MKMEDNKQTIILLLTALVGAVLFGLYYYVVAPQQDAARSKANTVASLQQSNAEISQQITTLQEQQTTSVSDVRLHKKVPEKRYIEKILRSLEEIETLTGTRIEGIQFNDYDNAVEPPMPEEAEVEGANAETETEPVVEGEVALPVLENLKTITYEVQIKTPNYKELRVFINEVEKLERIMKIDMVDIAQPGEEVKFTDKPDTSLEATLQLTTYFYE